VTGRRASTLVKGPLNVQSCQSPSLRSPLEAGDNICSQNRSCHSGAGENGVTSFCRVREGVWWPRLGLGFYGLSPFNDEDDGGQLSAFPGAVLRECGVLGGGGQISGPEAGAGQVGTGSRVTAEPPAHVVDAWNGGISPRSRQSEQTNMNSGDPS
jgi:hypothetical protein